MVITHHSFICRPVPAGKELEGGDNSFLYTPTFPGRRPLPLCDFFVDFFLLDLSDLAELVSLYWWCGGAVEY